MRPFDVLAPFRRNNRVEAAIAQTTTPRPLSLDDGDQPYMDLSGLNPFDALAWEPTPYHIDQLCRRSQEWGNAIKAIRNQVWRLPLKVEAAFAFRCMECGATTEDDATGCPKCHAPKDALRQPDEATRQFLEEKIKRINDDRQDLESIGRLLSDDANKHSNTFAVLAFGYQLTPEGWIDGVQFNGVYRGDPRVMRIIQDDDGHMGGKAFICMRCRAKPGYQAEKVARPCAQCKGATYDAWYAEEKQGKVRAYYLPNEVWHEDDWHYPTVRGGDPPGLKLWYKAISLLWMDHYASQALNPRRDKRMDKLITVLGASKESTEATIKDDQNKRRKNPYAVAVWNLPSPPVVQGASVIPDVKVHDLGDEQFKLQSIDLRKEFKTAIINEYGLQPIDAADTSSSGGMNNEGLQVRVRTQTVEFHQRLFDPLFKLIVAALGAVDCKIAFPPPLEENQAQRLDIENKELDKAAKARGLGLKVKWTEGKAVIQNGEIAAPTPEPGAGADGDGGPRGSMRSPEVSQARSIPSSSRHTPEKIKAALSGPSGAALAMELLNDDPFAGLTAEQSFVLRNEIANSLSQRQGWSLRSIQDRILPILKEAAIENPEARAKLIARCEVAAAIGETRIDLYQEEEAMRGETFEYRVVGADDFRTTKLSRWIRAQVGDAKPLNEVLRIMDRGVELAKQGAFREHGSLGMVQGQPIHLPPDFKRRGEMCHFGERDNIVRVVG